MVHIKYSAEKHVAEPMVDQYILARERESAEETD